MAPALWLARAWAAALGRAQLFVKLGDWWLGVGLGDLPAEGTCDRQDARINRRILSAVFFAGVLSAHARILGLGSVVLSHVLLLVAKAILEGPAQYRPPWLLPRMASKQRLQRCALTGCLRADGTPRLAG